LPKAVAAGAVGQLLAWYYRPCFGTANRRFGLSNW
jgi:hypothetical protein